MAIKTAAKRRARAAVSRTRRDTWTWGDRVVERLPRPVRAMVSRAREDEVLLLGAGLSFYAMVSLVPLIILTMSVVSLVLGDQGVHRLARELGRVAPKNLGADHAIQRVADLGTRLGVVAFVTGLWPATSYGAGLTRAFDRLSPTTDRRLEGFRGRGLILIVLFPLFVVGAIAGSYLGSQALGSGLLGSALGTVFALVTGFVGAAVSLCLIYRIFPPQRLSWRSILIATAAAAGTISVISVLLIVYVNFGTDFAQHYATSGLAAMVLTAVWLFLANAVVLVGYKLGSETERQGA